MMEDLLRMGKGVNLESLLAGMTTGIDRLRSIVDDMLDVSMIDNNLLTLNFQPMQVAQMLEALYLEVEDTLKKRNLHMEVKTFGGNRQWIYVDPARMMQAIRNVIANAIKFTPDGGIITIDGRTLQGPGRDL
jgi:signal transduction histidine kinase